LANKDDDDDVMMMMMLKDFRDDELFCLQETQLSLTNRAQSIFYEIFTG